MSSDSVTLPLAFVAGLLSFLSPCVLPLVPAYLGYLGGTAVLSAGKGTGARTGAPPLLHAVLFVLGFTAVFVALGASATLLGRLLFEYRIALARVGGVLLAVFGLRLLATGWGRGRWIVAAAVAATAAALLGSGWLVAGQPDLGEGAWRWIADGLLVGMVVLCGSEPALTRRIALGVTAGVLNLASSYDAPVPAAATSVLIALVAVFLNRADVFYAERRLDVGRTSEAGLARSFLFGIVFAAGWTPCIGPILTGILVLASRLETVGQGVLLLTAYSLGLGIPFLLVGLALAPLSSALRRLSRFLPVVSVASGVLLVLMGLLIFTDSLSFLAQYGNLIDLEF